MKPEITKSKFRNTSFPEQNNLQQDITKADSLSGEKQEVFQPDEQDKRRLFILSDEKINLSDLPCIVNDQLKKDEGFLVVLDKYALRDDFKASMDHYDEATFADSLEGRQYSNSEGRMYQNSLSGKAKEILDSMNAGIEIDHCSEKDVKEQDRIFIQAAEEGDYMKLNNLSKEGYIPSSEVLEQVNPEGEKQIAIEKIFNLPDNKGMYYEQEEAITEQYKGRDQRRGNGKETVLKVINTLFGGSM